MILIIIVLYLAVTVAIGLIANKNAKTASSFHGAGLGVLMCVAAGTGEWLGGTSTTGVSEYGYDFGISGSWYTIANGIGIIFLAIFFAKLYRSLETVTVPGIIGHFIGTKARIVSSILLTFVMLAVGTSQVVAAGTLGAVFGLDYVAAVIVLGVGFIIYTLAGGMIAVGYTNMLHLVAMYGGVILAVLLAGSDVGGLTGMREALPESYFSMTAVGVPRVSSWVIASLLGACTAQAGIQPILAAKDVNVAKKASVITAFVVAPFGLLTAFLGMMAKIKFPDLVSGKEALPALMMSLNPVAGGIVLASILAAVLSTISPIILASGTMLTKDIYQRRLRPDATDAQVLRVSRITTAAAGVICIIVAILMYDSSRILDIVYFAYTLRGCMFVVLLLGIYWKRTSERGAIFGMLVTVAVGFLWVSFKAVTGTYPIHPGLNETYISVIAALVSTVIFSFIFKKQAQSQH
ncbi:MAG: sodium:solute symporter family protein [Clostridiales bacterium]|jgi:SSS family solute:Na+ symporter|nr:sodium:solute symporter family protein [Clostridiales bacterium]